MKYLGEISNPLDMVTKDYVDNAGGGGLTIDDIFPIGSTYVTSTSTTPPINGTSWTLVDKSYKYSWITNAFTWNTTNTSNGAFVALPRGHSIEFRWVWNNRVALSDNDQVIGTLDWSKVGISPVANSHQSFPIAYCDGCNAIGMMYLNASDGQFGSHDWASRATSLPTTTNQPVYCSHMVVVQDMSSMVDSFCDVFVWKRTA